MHWFGDHDLHICFANRLSIDACTRRILYDSFDHDGSTTTAKTVRGMDVVNGHLPLEFGAWLVSTRHDTTHTQTDNTNETLADRVARRFPYFRAHLVEIDSILLFVSRPILYGRGYLCARYNFLILFASVNKLATESTHIHNATHH